MYIFQLRKQFKYIATVTYFAQALAQKLYQMPPITAAFRDPRAKCSNTVNSQQELCI